MRKSAAFQNSIGKRSIDDASSSSSKNRRGQLQLSLVHLVVLKFLHSRWFYRIVFILANLIFVVAIISTQSSSSGSSLRLTLAPSLPFHPLRQPTRIQFVPGKQLMSHVGYAAKPKVVGVYFTNQTSASYMGAQVLPTYVQRRLTHNIVPLSRVAIRSQLHLLDSDDYEDSIQEPFEDGSCKARYKWMYMANPVCNFIHETDLSNLKAKNKNEMKVSILSSGFWRDVWKIQNGMTERVVLKTLRYQHDFDGRNYDRHRRDAMATERLTWSPNIINIYGFCGNSGVYEFAPGGDIEDVLFNSDAVQWNSTERLTVAFQVASAIADTHDSERDGIPAIAHTDITTAQFVHLDGIYKLNDFNRCRFIPYDEKRQRNCGFRIPNNPGTFRAPEEYTYDLESEKVDIYSMGNIFFALVTKEWPFEEDEEKDAKIKVINGKRPKIPRAMRESNDPADKALLKVTAMCWEQDPQLRPTALEAKDFLAAELNKLGVSN